MGSNALLSFRLTKFLLQTSNNLTHSYVQLNRTICSGQFICAVSKSSRLSHQFNFCRQANTTKAPWMETGLKTNIIGGPPPPPPEDEDEETKKRNREESWRKTKFSLILLGSSMGLAAGFLAYSLGRPKIGDDGSIIEDEFSSLPTVTQYIKRMIKELEYYNKMIKDPSYDKLLPDPLPYPYMQPPYTLILELTDLLVHPEWTYQTGWRFKKRPGVDKFLEQVGPPTFEIVVYTAEQGLTVFPILNALDPNGYIMYRLVRDATDFIDGHHVKNLEYINRDLKKVIVVDWNANSVKLHRENAFIVPRWKGNDDDTTLVDLAAFLRAIASNEVEDVRDVLTYYQQFDNPIEAFRENQRKLLEQLEEQERNKNSQRPPLTSKWSPTIFNPIKK